MLQNIRDNVQGTVAKVIIAFIIVSFAIFGIETLFGVGGPPKVAEVNGDPITEQELQQAIELQKRQLIAMMGENIQPAMLDDNNLRGPALEALITQHLLQQAASGLKLRLPDQAVDQTILSMPQFQEDGKFSPDRYQALLRNQGYTPAYFKQLLQQELLINQLQSGVVDSDFVTEAELKAVAGLLQQQRTFDYVLIPAAALAAKIEPADADIDAYYKEHQDQFLSQERVKVEYIDLRESDFHPALDEAAVRAEYERELADFHAATERQAAHILIETNDQRNDEQAKALAESVAQKIAAGEDFAALAKQYSDDLGSKNSGGDLGTTTGDTFPSEFEAALAKLAVGAVSAPVKTDAGYHVIKLVRQEQSKAPSFEERREAISQRLQQAEAQPKLVQAVEKLRDLVFNSDGLRGPAESLQVKVQESEWFSRDGAPAPLSDPKLIAAAFSDDVLKDHNNSDVIELAPDHYVVLRMKEHQPAAPRALAEVKPAIVELLKRQQAAAEGHKIAEQLAAKVREGGDLAKLAEAGGYQAQHVANASRSSGTASGELLRAAFAVAKPGNDQPALNIVNLDNGDVALVRLQAVNAGTLESLNTAQQQALTAQLARSEGSAGFAAFMQRLKGEADIERN